jgi:dihydrolipoamide dehydrogenase
VTDQVYDIVVIGGGPGGYTAGIRAAQHGARVALVEKDRLGGTCLNRGCIPTKAIVRDAEVYRDVASGAYCVEIEGGVRADIRKLMVRKRQVVDTLVAGVEHLMASHRIRVIRGVGRLVDARTVRVSTPGGSETLVARAIIIASGSVPARVPIDGADLPGVVTSDGLLEIDELPRRLVVVGGSVVGVEFACAFNALGVEVAIVGRRTFLADADQQLARRFRALLSRRGVSINTGLDFRDITRADDGTLHVNYVQRGAVAHAAGDLVLLSTGRTPFTEGLGLAQAGIATSGQAIAVDEHLQTSVAGVYAIGDCTGGLMLAHVASYEAEVAVDNILVGPRAADYRVVPNCIFTIPEIADVGLTEDQAREAGLRVRVSRFPFGVSGRAVAMGEGEGIVRMVCEAGADGRGGRVLGVHVMGPRAGDLIAEASLAMQLGATAEQIAHTIHAHPTVPEALMEAAMAQGIGAIHFEQR